MNLGNSFLVLRVGTRNYGLGEELLLKAPGLDWIAAELSDWLGLPVSKHS